jgi:NAD(P)-dependent dehydrogenase (short-subunit alcohol dehydrogenase family)
MTGKVAVITGATGGIGKEVCKYLAQKGYTIYAAYRSESKRNELLSVIPAAQRVNFHFFKLDLTSISSAHSFCNKIIESLDGEKISLLLNNAGMIADKFLITPDGFEKTMQVNYISAKIITEQLLDHINGKIINTISCTIHTAYIRRALKNARGEFNPSEKSFKLGLIRRLVRYSDSKLMLAFYTLYLAERVSCGKNNSFSNGNRVEVYGADPGIVDTGIITMHRWYDSLANIIFRPFIRKAAEGARQIINAIEYNMPDQYNDDNRLEYPLLFINNTHKSFPKNIRRKYGRARKIR